MIYLEQVTWLRGRKMYRRSYDGIKWTPWRTKR